MYRCPDCDHEPFDSISGWKRHMSAKHGGWSDEQVVTAAGGEQDEGTHLSGEDSFADFAATMPDEASGFLESDKIVPATEGGETETSSEDTTRQKRVVSRKMKAKMGKLKKRIATDLPRAFFAAKGLELDDEGASLIEEAFDTALEVIGVEFDIEPMNATIRSKWFVLAYPFVIGLFVFLMKKNEQEITDKAQGSAE